MSDDYINHYLANDPNIHISADEMWKVINKEGSNNFGIAGYEAPKNYLDPKKIKKDRETWEMHKKVWFNKGHYPVVKPKLDKDGKPIIPTKTNFIDDCIKQVHSNHSKEKFDKYVEFLKGKGKTLEEVEGIKIKKKSIEKDKNKSKIYRHDRSTYIADIYANEKKKEKLPDHLVEVINKTKEKQARYTSPNKSSSEMMQVKYKGKSSLPKADRITVMADAEYLGEVVPFYYTKPEDPDEAAEKKKSNTNNKNLFFPDKIALMEKSPKWKWYNSIQVDRSYQQRRDDLQKEKVDTLKKSWESKRIKFIDDVSLSYFKLQGHKGGYNYRKPIKKTEQYTLAKETNPDKYPGPQQYFKMPLLDLKKSPNKKNYSEDNDTKEDQVSQSSPKVFYADRDKTDKRIYKPMKNYVF